ncbi:hypothetical protein CLU79DRAFT_736839 [Phycomyces nitens]|nr:hypothetical protein CLU79DRAFT_736839 [Phycomyces nitens]
MRAIRRYSVMALPVSRTHYYGAMSSNSLFVRRGSGEDQTILGSTVSQCTLALQMKFIRKVYGLALIQLAVLGLLSISLSYLSFFTGWLEASKYGWLLLLLPVCIFQVAWMWWLWGNYFQMSRTSQAVMLIVGSILTIFVLSLLICKLFSKQGALVILLSSFGLVLLIFYSLQTHLMFSGPFPIVLCLTIIYLGSLCVRQALQLDFVEIVWPLLISSILCVYFILDLYYLVGYLTPEDYILANICLYVDLMVPFRCVHNLCELTDRITLFSDVFNPHRNEI